MNTEFRKLMSELAAIGLPPDDFVVFGSGPMAARGLRDVSDLDVVARGEAWETAKKIGTLGQTQSGDTSYFFADGKIEICDKWGPIQWDTDMLIDTADIIDGVRFVKIETVMQDKLKRGREKDLKDAELIGRYMAGIGEQGDERNPGLSEYHQRYAALSDEEIAARIAVKKDEFAAVLEASTVTVGKSPILIAVMGCPDRRLIPLHQKMFEDVLVKTVKMTTYDITTDHLEGVPGVVKHDVTEPLPGGPYDFILAHVLLRFVEEDQQWYVLFNSYDALKPGGVAIHVLDEQDYSTKGDVIPNGYHTVPLEKWKDKMRALDMEYIEMPVPHGVALAIIRK